MKVLELISSYLWHDYVLYFLLLVGLLFTIWSRFCQFRAISIGSKLILGQHEKKDAPGAINHFEALSAALSATVGLGNIAGVAIAISIGGPGAVFWMWVVGFIGMALKTTEVTQSMLYRNLSDPSNPHGGPMWVAAKGFAGLSPKLEGFGKFVAGVFCVTLLISCMTGGNMFQAWNVAEITHSYFQIPKLLTGAVLTVGVGLVILGGITRIGKVAGTIVPVMCGIYLVGGLFVLFTHVGEIPSLLKLIVLSGLPDWAGGQTPSATGAFLGGTAGLAFLKGMQRALFSNEAGQGSAPIAHSAAKTNEPASEGVVAGLEPFVDTLVVCSITALVILISGIWQRPADLQMAPGEFIAAPTQEGAWTFAPTTVTSDITQKDGVIPSEVYVVIETAIADGSAKRQRLGGALTPIDGGYLVNWESVGSVQVPRLAEPGVFFEYKGATLTAKAFDLIFPSLGIFIVPLTVWFFAFSTMISWSYYGEQGVVFLLGEKGVMPYRLIFCVFVFLATTPLIRTEYELDVISGFGTGVMLMVNIPLMLVFGHQAMRAYHQYVKNFR